MANLLKTEVDIVRIMNNGLVKNIVSFLGFLIISFLLYVYINKASALDSWQYHRVYFKGHFVIMNTSMLLSIVINALRRKNDSFRLILWTLAVYVLLYCVIALPFFLGGLLQPIERNIPIQLSVLLTGIVSLINRSKLMFDPKPSSLEGRDN